MRNDAIIKKGVLKLLQIKDSDIRIKTLKQGASAVDKGIHSGGALSAVIPLTVLYYGDIMNYSAEDTTAEGQDLFVLSKGHAVAAMASVYADVGYFAEEVLINSRSAESILNGHPGPILPGVHISTGPLGQGCCVAQGYALAGAEDDRFDVFSLLGDGELQEGIVWESVMFAGHKHLDNLCFIVDRNKGQLDRSDMMIVPMDTLEAQFASFGWNVYSVDGMQYEPVFDALKSFKESPRNGKPTVIISNTEKGYGGFSHFLSNHKITLSENLAEQEIKLQKQRRDRREASFLKMLEQYKGNIEVFDAWKEAAKKMYLLFDKKSPNVTSTGGVVVCKPVPKRDKKIVFNDDNLPKLDSSKEYGASNIVRDCMKTFAVDERVVSIDADLSSTSGLQAGVGYVDTTRALNVGIAEANMMNIGEAYASLGYNTWISTFCPFFDIKVLRRIAVGQQERLEAIEDAENWLSEGHINDMTLLATAPNFETKTNGATHMGNDDIMIINEIGHVKIIDVSCPNQLINIMKWIMEGNKGLVYVRIMRSPSAVLYTPDADFVYGKGYYLRSSEGSSAVIVSSGRGVHEALGAADILKEKGITTDVIDMPSVDEKLMKELYVSGKIVVFAEQNNGYLWAEFRKRMFSNKLNKTGTFFALNAEDAENRPQFIHSAQYEELIAQFKLTSEGIASEVASAV